MLEYTFRGVTKAKGVKFKGIFKEADLTIDAGIGFYFRKRNN